MIDVVGQLDVLRGACVAVRGEAYCTPTVVQAMGAIARHETCFNTCRPFVDKGNYGALQCGQKAVGGKCPEHCFPATDTSPTSSGGSIPYLACFQDHGDDEAAGAFTFASLVAFKMKGVALALPSGDARTIAKAMREAGYFEGFGRTQADRIEGYAVALQRNAAQNAADAFLPNLILLPPPAPPPQPVVPPEVQGGMIGALIVGLIVAGIRRFAGTSSAADS